jgi:hypothetical protein
MRTGLFLDEGTMTHLGKLTVALLAASALPALAYDLGNGFTVTGDVELEYASADSTSISAGFTDVTLSWRSQGTGALTYGFDLTNVSLHDLDDDESESALWLGLVVGTSFGEFSVGRPRPLHDTMFDTPDVGAARVLGFEFLGLGPSFLASIALLEGSSLDIWGLTYTGQSGGLTYGAGLHRLSSGSNSLNIYELVVKYETGATEVYAGFETGDNELDDLNKLVLGANYTADRWSAGLQAISLNASGNSLEAVKLFGDYVVLDGLTVGAQYQRVTGAGAEELNIYGLSGIYSFGVGFAELGLSKLETPSGSGDTVTTASIGLRF